MTVLTRAPTFAASLAATSEGLVRRKNTTVATITNTARTISPIDTYWTLRLA